MIVVGVEEEEEVVVALQVGVPAVLARDDRVRVVVLEPGGDQQRIRGVRDEHLGGEGWLGPFHRLGLDESVGHGRERPDLLVEPPVGHRDLLHERHLEHLVVIPLGGGVAGQDQDQSEGCCSSGAHTRTTHDRARSIGVFFGPSPGPSTR